MSDTNKYRNAIEESRDLPDSKLTERVVKWLANRWDVPPGYVDEFFEMQASTYFLLVWPIFEQKVCDGFMETGKMRNIAMKFTDCYDELAIDDILRRFYDRYKDRNLPESNWASLCQNDHWEAKSTSERVLNQPWNKSKPTDKLQFGLYVIYRFRNNIFHGNKKIFEWLQNRPQIEDCVMVLLKLTEQYDRMSPQ